MTPKEKAKELVERFDLPTGLMSSERKQCALICVGEIILDRLGGGAWDYEDVSPFTQAEISYWQMVKEEINKL